MTTTASFSIKDALGFGWAMVKEKLGFFCIIFVISWFFSALPDMIGAYVASSWVNFFVQVVSIVIGFVVDASLIAIMLRLYDGKEVKVADIFSQYPIVFRYFVASVAFGIMVALGLLLLVIPGIYLALRYQFFSYFIIDKRLDIVESFKQSAKVTDGQKWHLFRFWLALIGVNILGFLALIVGLLVTMPLSMLAVAYAYRKLSSPVAEKEEEMRQLEEVEKVIPEELEENGVKTDDSTKVSGSEGVDTVTV